MSGDKCEKADVLQSANDRQRAEQAGQCAEVKVGYILRVWRYYDRCDSSQKNSYCKNGVLFYEPSYVMKYCLRETMWSVERWRGVMIHFYVPSCDVKFSNKQTYIISYSKSYVNRSKRVNLSLEVVNYA